MYPQSRVERSGTLGTGSPPKSTALTRAMYTFAAGCAVLSALEIANAHPTQGSARKLATPWATNMPLLTEQPFYYFFFAFPLVSTTSRFFAADWYIASTTVMRFMDSSPVEISGTMPFTALIK